MRLFMHIQLIHARKATSIGVLVDFGTKLSGNLLVSTLMHPIKSQPLRVFMHNDVTRV